MGYKRILQCMLLMSTMTVQSMGVYAESASTIDLANVTQQTKQVTGLIIDENGEPLIGATVAFGPNQGTVTDLDGNFKLTNVPENATLQISYVGYQNMTVKVAGKNHIKVTMQPDAKVIDEVMVIGYGVQKKSNVTGAISSIKADDLKNSTITNAASALQGKVSGVQVVNNSGAPGSAPVIRVRGYSSNGSSDPLYIVDGLKVSDISYLDPSSIKSMEILKDAASAAIYGAEAGNGVVLITTKNGDSGKTLITFDAQWTFSKLAKKVDLMDANAYTKFYTEGLGDTFTALYNQYNIAGTNTDWQDEMYETGKMQKYNVGFQGGNDKGNFFVSLGYMNNDGMVRLNKDYYRRLNGQVNASYKLRPWLEVGTSNTIMATNSATLTESNSLYGQMKDFLLADPLTPVFYDNNNLPDRLKTVIANGLSPIRNAAGRYYGYSWINEGCNPLAGIEASSSQYKMSSINGSTYANITPIKNLVFTTRLGYTIGNVTNKDYHPVRWNSYFSDTDSDMKLMNTQYTTRYYQWENFANYILKTKDAGDFSLMVGMSYSNYDQESVGGQTNQLSNTASNFVHLNFSTSSADDRVMGLETRRKQIAYYGRLSWDWLDRYHFQTNFRADSYDAAYLDLNHNWGYFPSCSFGWTFSNEEFMKNLVGDFFTSGKLRASYGVNGSISNLGNYMYAAILNSGQYDVSTGTANMAYWLNGSLHQGIYPSKTLANPELRWERSKQWDLGLDLRFFKGRLTMTMDYYNKLTDGLLVETVAPLTTGASTVYRNLGKVTNKGFEIEADWKDNIGDFKYGVKAELATVSNKVKEYAGAGNRISGSKIAASDTYMTYFEEGYPLWYIRGYQYEGVDETTGAPIYKDLDNDGNITDADRTSLGSGIPKFTYGLTLSASYKGFDFNIYGAGASGNKLVYAMMSTSNKTYSNRPTFLTDNYWTSTNPHAEMPGAVYQINDSRFYNSSAFVFDASFFKIKQIQLGYTLPKKLSKQFGIENLRVYASLDNFFTFTSYPGSDPEVNASGNSSSAMALDYGGYPASKSMSIGFNLSF